MAPEPISQASRCFAFEQDLIGNWRCIPLCLRRKLDLAGIKLRLSHWLSLDPARRQELVFWPDGPDDLRDLASHIRVLTRAMAEGEATELPVVRGEPWQGDGAPPEALLESAAALGQPLSPAAWQGLGELERFALCKLARPGHDHHNLPAALAELLG